MSIGIVVGAGIMFFVPEDYFHEHYPDNFKYKTIIFGLESSLYNNLKPF